jgi:hypothetical protein
MSAESLVKARAAQAAVRARPEVIYECPKGDPQHRITMLIPVQGIRCPHGQMKKVSG